MVGDLQAEVTTLLGAIRGGDERARDRLGALVYEELRRLAAGLMLAERADHTLQPTALVHEAYLRLCTPEFFASATDRAYFFAAAARAMRQVLVDHARARARQKRGGLCRRVPLDDVLDHFQEQCRDVLALHDALDELAGLSARQARVVELRFFGGHTVAQVAGLLGLSVSAVEGDFRKASAFLRGRLRETG
jgi:RNA polymerase sigma factor (TIGR02999 family)